MHDLTPYVLISLLEPGVKVGILSRLCVRHVCHQTGTSGWAC